MMKKAYARGGMQKKGYAAGGASMKKKMMAAGGNMKKKAYAMGGALKAPTANQKSRQQIQNMTNRHREATSQFPSRGSTKIARYHRLSRRRARSRARLGRNRDPSWLSRRTKQ